MVEHWGGVPGRVQMIVSFRERTRRRPELMQQGGEIVRVGGYSRIEFGNWDVSDFHLFPSFGLVCLEDLVERLFSGRRDQVLLKCMTAFRQGVPCCPQLCRRNGCSVAWRVDASRHKKYIARCPL